MTDVLAFDLETIPNTDFGRRFFGMEGSDAEVAQAMFAKRLEVTDGKSDFLKTVQHQVVCLSMVWRDGAKDTIKVGSFAQPNLSEAEILTKFFGLIDAKKPRLVSWNGKGFDAPVLHLRAMRHTVASRTYWATDGQAKWDNYIQRYQDLHLDLMDVLASYQARAASSLDEMSVLLGLPGKMGIGGDKITEAWFAGQHDEIRRYCEIDALNTYLIFVRFQVVRGLLQPDKAAQEEALVRAYLGQHTEPHLKAFLERWSPTQ